MIKNQQFNRWLKLKCESAMIFFSSRSLMVAIFGLMPIMCPARDWYVAPSGASNSGASDGSMAAPWRGFKNIYWGSGGVDSGDTLHLLGGHPYLETLLIKKSGGAEQPIKVVCDGPDACIIDGEGTRHSGVRGIGIGNVEVTGISTTGHVNSGIRFEESGSNILIQNCRTYNNSQYGIFIVTTSGFMSQVTMLNNVANGNGMAPPSIGSRGSGAGIFIATGPTGIIEGVVVKGNEANSNRGRYGIGVYASFGGPWIDGKIANVLISANKTNDNGNAGIDLSKNVTGAKIFDNDAYGNGLDEPGSGLHVGGVEGASANNVEIYRNRVGKQKLLQEDGSGILVDDYAHYISVYNNLVENNEEAGIKLHNSNNVNVYANLIIGERVGVKTPGALAYRIYNNTIIDAVDAGIDVFPQTTSALVANNVIMKTPVTFRVQNYAKGVQYVNNCLDAGANQELSTRADYISNSGNVAALPKDAIILSESPEYRIHSGSPCNIIGFAVSPLQGYGSETFFNGEKPFIGAFESISVVVLPKPALRLRDANAN